MKYLVVLLVLSSLVIIGCSDNNEPVATQSSGTSSLLAKGNTKTTCPAKVNYAGKTYNTVQVGSQCWLKENLDVGTMIPRSQDASNNRTIEKYCYNNDPSNCATYGGLYQWNEAMQYSTIAGTQGICPKGWHVPTLAEFQTLTTAVSYDANALKAVGQGVDAGAGTNTSGFSAMMAGARDNVVFSSLDFFVYFWSSTEYDSLTSVDMELASYDSGIRIYYYENKQYGESVRCIKD